MYQTFFTFFFFLSIFSVFPPVFFSCFSSAANDRGLRVVRLSQSCWKKSENWQKIRIDARIILMFVKLFFTVIMNVHRLYFVTVNNYLFIKSFYNEGGILLFSFCFYTSIQTHIIKNTHKKVVCEHVIFIYQIIFTCDFVSLLCIWSYSKFTQVKVPLPQYKKYSI